MLTFPTGSRSSRSGSISFTIRSAACAAGWDCSVRDVPLEELREQLERFGAIVPDVPVVANKRQHSDQ
ncbi:hypothetical protein GCM10020370_15590 [Paenibacillus hodogayensis]